MTFLRRHSKPITLILLVFFGGFLFVQPAKAGIIDWFANTAILGAANLVMFAVSTVAGFALDILAKLLDWVLGLTSFTNIPAVTLGWGIVRDTVNMFFVIILLVIAFATIFGIESYGLKAALPRLILAALLVNFSLTIAGVIVDFTNAMTLFFIKSAGGDQSISTALAQGMRITNIYQPAPSTSFFQAAGNVVQSGFAAFAGIAFSILFSLAAIFTFGAMIFMFLARVVMIWFLLVLSPAAWLLWILPATSGLWKKWWDTFLRYAFFAPIASFFLYLSILLVGQTRAVPGAPTTSSGASSLLTSVEGLLPATTNLWTQAASPAAVFQMILMVMLLIGGLVAASQLGAWGSKGALGIASKGGRGITNWSGRIARRGLTKAGMWLAEKIGGAGKGAEFIKKGGLAGAAARLLSMPGLRQLGGGIAAQQIQRLEAAEKAAIGKAEADLKSLSSDSIKAAFASYDWPKKVAALKVLAERKDLKAGGSLTERALQSGAILAAKYGEGGAIIRARPDLLKNDRVRRYVDPEATSYEDALKRLGERITPAQMKELHGAALKDAKVAEMLLSLSPRHWAQLLSESNRKNLGAIKEGMEAFGREIGKNLADKFELARHLEPTNPPLARWVRRSMAPGFVIVRGEPGERGEAEEERGEGGGRIIVPPSGFGKGPRT